MDMFIKPNTIIVLVGLVVIGAIYVISTKVYENSNGTPQEISTWIGIPLCCGFFYFYIYNFSFYVYLISLGTLFILFI